QIFGRKALGDEPARRESGLQILPVDDGESEAARRCGMVFRWFRLMKGNLETHDARHGAYRALQLGRRVAIVPAMPAEEDNGIAIATLSFLGEMPAFLGIKPNERLGPALAIEVGPLVGKTQMRFDDAPTEGLDIEHAGVAAEVPAHPCADIVLQHRAACAVDDPIVEHAVRSKR